MKTIDSFEGEYRFLSNFYFSPLKLGGIIYPTVEHAFQAGKTKDKNERMEISLLNTPGEAKRAGRKVKLREDWEQIKLEVMEFLVRLKFENYLDLKDKLLATGDAELIEGNWWNDRFWGVCKGKGENNLGKILMKIRSELLKGGINNEGNC
jgi:hypothetical protein